MPKSAKSLYSLLAAGLGTAMREIGEMNPCSNQHSVFVSRRYKFCPFCGQPLEVKFVCQGCGRRFLSEKAYHYHLYSKHHCCPQCGAKGVDPPQGMHLRGDGFKTPQGRGSTKVYMCGDPKCGVFFDGKGRLWKEVNRWE